MSFSLYLIGIVVLLAGLIVAAALLKVPAQWIAVGALVVLGIGILSAVARTRTKDGAP